MNTQIQGKWYAYEDPHTGDLKPNWCSKCAPTHEDNCLPIINIDPAVWTCSVCNKSLIQILDEAVKGSSTFKGFSARLINMGFSVFDAEQLMDKYGI